MPVATDRKPEMRINPGGPDKQAGGRPAESSPITASGSAVVDSAHNLINLGVLSATTTTSEPRGRLGSNCKESLVVCSITSCPSE